MLWRANLFFTSVTPTRFECLAPITLLVVALSTTALDAKQQTNQHLRGQQVYSDQCASCHGEQGKGQPGEYEQRLSGDLSVEALARVISETMPEEDPSTCVAEDAAAVASFIHKEFYSAAALQRIDQPRIELSHLTARQHQQSVAELLGSFGKPLWVPDDKSRKHQGLTAHYFAASHWKKEKQLAKQRDATVDFGDGVPWFKADGKYDGIPEDKDRKNKMGLGFSAYWHGGVVAPETGTYQISVESRNGFNLWINNLQQPLIDRWVRSDDTLTHRATINLLAGRLYSLKLEMFTFEDSAATMRLLWKPPRTAESPIPADCLYNIGSSEVAVLSTPFPPDDSSDGYQRGTDVSREWDSATTSAALEVANWISERIWHLSDSDERAPAKVKSFCRKFVERAFVTRLSEQEKLVFVDQHFQEDRSVKDSVKRVVILTLKSPRFLYPTVQPREIPFATARQLALFFWDSLPDDQLFKSASNGEIDEPSNREGHIYRMLNDPRSKQKLREFFHHWLHLEEVENLSKDKTRFPEFDQALVFDLRNSLDRFLEDIVWSDKPDYRSLFLSDHLFVNRRLAEFYSIDIHIDDPSDTDLPGSEFVSATNVPHQAGILTHPYLMSGLAYHFESSPIHRGVFVTRSLLGRSLKQPTKAVAPLTEAFDPELTVRQRVELQTKDTNCMACHRMINPLGFSLEQFDAVGRFRQEEKNRPIDTEVSYETRSGKTIAFSKPRDLAEFIANDTLAQKNFVRQLFQYYTKQPIEAFGKAQLDKLHRQFVESDYNILELLVVMAQLTIDQPEQE